MTDGGYSTTSEIDEHRHFCSLCGGVWSHIDESCIGSRFRTYSPYDPYYDCPACSDPNEGVYATIERYRA